MMKLILVCLLGVIVNGCAGKIVGKVPKSIAATGGEELLIE